MQFLLASSSPRRSALLHQIGVEFKVVSSDFNEPKDTGDTPWRVAETNALGKVLGVKSMEVPAIWIGADTIVVVDDIVLGKPDGEEMAIQMLEQLSGRQHEVITGLALRNYMGKTVVGHEITRVRFRQLGRSEIRSYVNSKEPMDKAGAYAIQGRAALFVEGIEGCYSNVVGLPLGLLNALLYSHWSIDLSQLWR